MDSASHDRPRTPEQLEAWLNRNGVGEVECIVPDINGILRGKVVPANKFIKSVRDRTLRIASSVFVLTVTGEYPDDDVVAPLTDPDVMLIPDPATARMATGYKTPTAFVIMDPLTQDGEEVRLAPRTVLARVLDLYASKGWKPVVAPELEFFLTAVNEDPDYPLVPPKGRSGRPETGRQPFGLEALNEYEDLIEEIYESCKTANLDIDTMIHESGAAQLEINFNHGDPMDLADQVLLFKRIVRQVALQFNVYATFMAKPMENEPGSAMHIHQSIIDIQTGANIFSTPKGRDSALFRSYVAGLQRLLPQMTPLFAPNVNSYRRMRPQFDAPINVQWGIDNRSCGLRIPISAPEDRRVENRLPGADANPYLAMASSLLCGYVGMVERMVPRRQVQGSAYRLARTLPTTLYEAIDSFARCKPARKYLSDEFVRAFVAIKKEELDAYQQVISSWEREFLLLKV